MFPFKKDVLASRVCVALIEDSRELEMEKHTYFVLVVQ